MFEGKQSKVLGSKLAIIGCDYIFDKQLEKEKIKTTDGLIKGEMVKIEEDEKENE